MLCLCVDDIVFRKPACIERGCCFKCVSGLCPFGYDIITDCFPHMSDEERNLFMELFHLRSILSKI